jgi:hypothetical protein
MAIDHEELKKHHINLLNQTLENMKKMENLYYVLPVRSKDGVRTTEENVSIDHQQICMGVLGGLIDAAKGIMEIITAI